MAVYARIVVTGRSAPSNVVTDITAAIGTIDSTTYPNDPNVSITMEGSFIRWVVWATKD